MYPTKCLTLASLLKLRGWASRIPSVYCKHSSWLTAVVGDPGKCPECPALTLAPSLCWGHTVHLIPVSNLFLWYKETGPKFCKENLTFNRMLLFIVWRLEKSRMKTAAQDLRQTQQLAA